MIATPLITVLTLISLITFYYQQQSPSSLKLINEYGFGYAIITEMMKPPEHEPQKEDETMSTADAAEFLGVSTVTLWRWIKRGAIPAIEHENALRTRMTYRIPTEALRDIKCRLDAGERVLSAKRPGRKPRRS
jgi:excisionase family DNA binding protein